MATHSAPTSIPPPLLRHIRWLDKPKFKYHRHSSPFKCYELSTGYACVDGYYWSKGEAMSAILSEDLLLTLLKENTNDEE